MQWPLIHNNYALDIYRLLDYYAERYRAIDAS